MSKLIYVDRLKKDILALPNCYNGFSDTFDKACIIGVIDEQPTVEERKTGKWLAPMTCSECGGEPWYSSNEKPYAFCPYCGARMEGNT